MAIYKENALIWWRGIGWSIGWRPAGLVLFPSVEKIALTEGLRGYTPGCQAPSLWDDTAGSSYPSSISNMGEAVGSPAISVNDLPA